MATEVQQQSLWKPTLGIALLGALIFFPFLGGVHLFDWDEINFAEISREMLLTGDYGRVYIDYQPFWEKPPLFFWLQSATMAMLGVGEYAARLPNAVCGAISLAVLFRLGASIGGVRLGYIWAGVYLGSVLPMLYFKSGIIDPVFNLFIFLGLYYFIRAYWKHNGIAAPGKDRSVWALFALSGWFIGLAMLTKGQAAYMIAALTFGVYWVYQRFRLYITIPQFLWFTIFAALVTLAWFGWETWKNGPFFVTEFVKYQWRLFSTPDAGHKGFPGYHIVVQLVGCFPASIFALQAFLRRPQAQAQEEAAYRADFRRWMKFLFWTVIVLFSIVQSKIVHYSSLAYFPLTYLAAEVIDRWWAEGRALPRWASRGLWMVGGLYVMATLALPWIGKNIAILRDKVSDPFARGNMEADVVWTGWEVLPGLWLLGVLLLATRNLAKGKWPAGLATLFGGVTLFVLLTLGFAVGRIEGYSQRAAIEFFESLKGRDVYATTYGYKSYAHLFYAGKRPGLDARSHDREWLLHGDVDKDVYISTKVHKAAELDSLGYLERLYEKNGFVFFVRKR